MLELAIYTVKIRNMQSETNWLTQACRQSGFGGLKGKVKNNKGSGLN